jgi:hypothetical protein
LYTPSLGPKVTVTDTTVIGPLKESLKFGDDERAIERMKE